MSSGEYQPYYDPCTNCVRELPISCRYCKVIHLENRNAALREKLAAANKRADAVIEDIKRMDRYIAKSDDPYAALCEVCKYKPQHGGKCKRCDVHDNAGFEYRGGQEGE